MPWKILVGKRPFKEKSLYYAQYGVCKYREKEIWINDEYLYRDVRPDDYFDSKSPFVILYSTIHSWISRHVFCNSTFHEFMKMTSDERFYSALNHELYHAANSERYESYSNRVMIACIFALWMPLSFSGVMHEALILMCSISMFLIFMIIRLVIPVIEERYRVPFLFLFSWKSSQWYRPRREE